MTQEMILVTGAGSGIGLEFARLFLKSGAKVLAVSLLQDELDQLQAALDPEGERLKTLVMDLSVPNAAAILFEWCQKQLIIVDTLINNAGFACYGDTVDLDMKKLNNMLILNIVTLTELCRLFGEDMKQRRRGHILNVGSTAGMIPAPRLAAYGASKAYVNSFSYALRAELAPFSIKVTCLTPGTVQTKFAQSGDFLTFNGKSRLKGEYASGKASSPAEVAEAGYRGLIAGKAQVLVGRGARIASVASRLIAQRTLPNLLKNV